MAIINILDKHTAELIAAGEVVERPASVVKELTENAIDAGATAITVSIEKGGTSLIQISDNGTGIEAEYIPTAFIRHATSKIKTGQDLENIHTLGFRGEALASVASVAKVELITKTQIDEFASSYRVEGGQEISFEAAARPVGTTINVRELFYNTPARIKFLKKDVSEANYVNDVIVQLALSNPQISFTFIREGKKQFQTPGDGNLKAAAYEVLSREFSKDLLIVDEINSTYHAKGLVTSPTASRASRAMQFFFVNGRFVKNNTMMAALEAAYKGTLMQKKYPGCVLFLQLPPQLVDVNVHPAKTQVRFANERDVFDTVYRAVKGALLSAKGEMREFDFNNAKAVNATVKENAVENQDYTNLKTQENNIDDSSELNSDANEIKAHSEINKMAKIHEFDIEKSENSKYQRHKFHEIKPKSIDIYVDDIEPLPIVSDSKPIDDEDMVLREEELVAYKKIGETKNENSWRNALNIMQSQENEEGNEICEMQTNSENHEEDIEQLNIIEDEKDSCNLKIIGEIFNTYIITQYENNMCLIDKHAAHERVLYEKLASEYKNVASQILLVPVTVKLSAQEKNAVMQYEQIIKDSGIEAEEFGISEMIIRAVPMDVLPGDAGELLIEIANKLIKNPKETQSEKTEWVLHSIACRAAIKGGDKTPINSLLQLAQDVISEKIPLFCPHGRPVILKITKKEIEKQFGR